METFYSVYNYTILCLIFSYICSQPEPNWGGQPFVHPDPGRLLHHHLHDPDHRQHRLHPPLLWGEHWGEGGGTPGKTFKVHRSKSLVSVKWGQHSFFLNLKLEVLTLCKFWGLKLFKTKYFMLWQYNTVWFLCECSHKFLSNCSSVQALWKLY